MNSPYWIKTVIKLINLIDSVYNFSNNGSKTENSGIKTSTLACEHVSTQSTLAREHVSMQGTLAREHVSTQNNWHVTTFLAHRARNLADSDK